MNLKERWRCNDAGTRIPAPVVVVTLLAGWNRAAGLDRCLVGVSATGYEAPLLIVRKSAGTILVAWTVVASCAAAASMSALEPAATVRPITRRRT
jgi:hypothetical protein